MQVKNFVATDERIETDYLIQEIKRLHESWLAYSDIGVIYKKHAHALDIIDVCKRNDIPFYKPAGEHMLDHPEAQKLIQTLKIIGNTHDNELLWNVLLFDFWELDIGYLLKMQSEFMGRGMNHWKNNLFGALFQSDDMNIQMVVRHLESFHALSANLTIVGFFEKFLEDTGYRKYILRQDDSLERLSILDTLFTEMKRYNADNPDATIHDFITYLDDCHKYNIYIGTRPLKFSPDAIHLMTAHGSKWLEYEAIFLYKTYTKNWEASRNVSKLPISVKIIWDEEGWLSKDELKKQKTEEQRRLFFVSMTRAKQYLCLLSTKNAEMKQDPSSFIYEIDEKHLEEVIHEPDQEAILANTTAPVVPLNWSEATETEIKERIKKYVLAPTHLNTWLKSPRLFYERHLIQQPMGKSRTLSFGTAIHAVLETATKYACDNKQAMTKELAYEALEKALTKEILTAHEREDEIEKGRIVIDTYFESEGSHLWEFALSEYRINKSRPVVIENMPCSGSLDRIEYLPNRDVRVVDYKTWSVKAPGTESWEDYERQLYFYKLLWDWLSRTEVLVEGCIDFVMHPKNGRVNRKIVEFDLDKLATLKEHIRLFRESLLADELDFPEEWLLPSKRK